MQQQGLTQSRITLEESGIRNANTVWWNLPTPSLYEQALQRHEALLAHLGPLVVRTGQSTGRSPNDRYVVKEPSSNSQIWWGEVNRPFSPEAYERLRRRVLAYLQGRDLFVQDCYVGADPEYRLPIRVVTERAWHSLFARNMFVREPDHSEAEAHVPQFTVIDAAGFNADPEADGTRSEIFVVLHFGRKEVLIGGTSYAGEIKKSMLSVMTYLLPPRDVLPMHCAANYGRDQDDMAIFFGLSGTGKTTLSTDSGRTLIGDDEHGWSDRGVFNFEGGCYAKVIRLSPEGEPEIYETTRRFGTILENVAIDSATRRLDLDDDAFTENTRASYPISHIPKAAQDGRGGLPKHVVFLTADAFGVLPPIAALTPAQATYHFLSGYTAKVAGTERGVTAPRAVFSPCYGAPFMSRPPTVYAKLLGEKLVRTGARVWLVNTGWTGGAYGVGRRIPLAHTRAMVRAALQGELNDAPSREDPHFRLRVPLRCADVPEQFLDPRGAWADASAYDRQAASLAAMFRENFGKFSQEVAAEIGEANPL
jgi:phosphoenolpyruvate carboxykinase (ATP)